MNVCYQGEGTEEYQGSPTMWHMIPQSSSVALLSLMMAAVTNQRWHRDGPPDSLAHKGLSMSELPLSWSPTLAE